MGWMVLVDANMGVLSVTFIDGTAFQYLLKGRVDQSVVC